jgi:hypothetical protein|tara:strand:- start:61 stop:612 length:552 start_codon:yes stop_codon:yes gene_type:complete
MKKPLLFIVGISFFFISCKEKIAKSENKIHTKIESELNFIEIEQKNKDENYIVLDSVTNSWITSLENISKKDKRFKIKLKISKNDHDSRVMDTIRTMTFDKTEITTYSTDSYYGIWTADIKNAEFPLWEYIGVGMKKYELEKTLAEGMNNDTIQIGNLEKTSVFEFYFKKGILERIKFEGYID